MKGDRKRKVLIGRHEYLRINQEYEKIVVIQREKEKTSREKSMNYSNNKR
jgi:hypothetical protein